MTVDSSPAQRWGGPGTPVGHVGLAEALRRYGLRIVGAALLGGLLGLGVSQLLPRSYVAESAVYPHDPRTPGVFGLTVPAPPRESFVLAVADAATSDSLTAAVAAKLGTSAADVRARVRAQPTYETGVVELSASGPDPRSAVRLLGAVSSELDRRFAEDRQRWLDRVLLELDPYEDGLRRRIQDADREQAALLATDGPAEELEALAAERDAAFTALLAVEARRNEVKVDTLSPGSGLFRPRDISLPEDPAQPQTQLLVMTGALLGLLVATALAWRRTERFPLLRRVVDAESLLDAPRLASLVTSPRHALWPREDRGGDLLQELEVGELVCAVVDSPSRTLSVCALRDDVDPALAALKLGVEAVRQGFRVLVVGIGDASAVEAASERVAKATGLDVAVIRAVLTGGRLQVAASAQAARADESVDLVLVVTDPVLGQSRSVAVGEPVVLVVPYGVALDQLRQAKEVLKHRRCEVLGFVLMDRHRKASRVRDLVSQSGVSQPTGSVVP